jgi:hypothetical protein
MTKKDLQTVAVGTAVGGSLALLLFFVLRKKNTLRELNPADVKWEGQ